jgi:hypothetical protein
LLHCLSEESLITEEFVRKLRELGIDLPALLKCLGERCRSTADELEARQLQNPYDAGVAQLKGIPRER